MTVAVDAVHSDHELVPRIGVREFGFIGQLRFLVLSHGFESFPSDLVLMCKACAEDECRNHGRKETAMTIVLVSESEFEQANTPSGDSVAFTVVVVIVEVDLRRRTIRGHYHESLELQRCELTTYMEMQFAIDTMNAVPTPRFGVGEKQFAAQLLQADSPSAGRTAEIGRTWYGTHMTRGNKLKFPPTTRKRAK